MTYTIYLNTSELETIQYCLIQTLDRIEKQRENLTVGDIGSTEIFDFYDKKRAEVSRVLLNINNQIQLCKTS